MPPKMHMFGVELVNEQKVRALGRQAVVTGKLFLAPRCTVSWGGGRLFLGDVCLGASNGA